MYYKQTSQNTFIMMRLNKKHNSYRKGKAKVVHKGTFTPATIEAEEGRERERKREIGK